mgnify:CR=1 FL=1
MIKNIKKKREFVLTKLLNYIKNIYEITRKPVMSILPGQLAFSFVMTIIPVIVLIAVIASTFQISLDSITEFIKISFPEGVSTLLLPLINGRGFDLSILTFLIAALWLASTGAYAVITASDVIYEVKSKNAIAKRIKSIVMIFLLLTLIMFMLIVPAFGDKIFNLIISLKIFAKVTNELTVIYLILKYPLSFILIYFNIKLIYTIAPSREISSKSVTRGSLFTTLMWMIITQLYSFWVNNVVHYDILYGSISNIIILLMWVYFLAYLFTIGLIINAGIDKGNNVNNINGWIFIQKGYNILLVILKKATSKVAFFVV